MNGKILLCRCEDVTLAEVERAIDEGHADIESVKRFTGFATGWCQGKQCLIACARVIERRTGAFAQAPVTPRPPLHPMPLGMLAGLCDAVSLERAIEREAGDEREARDEPEAGDEREARDEPEARGGSGNGPEGVGRAGGGEGAGGGR